MKFNGPLPSNATISLGVRKAGAILFEDFVHEVVTGENFTWKYNKAISGQKYEIQGYLWIENQPLSQSQILSVVAPADYELLTI